MKVLKSRFIFSRDAGLAAALAGVVVGQCLISADSHLRVAFWLFLVSIVAAAWLLRGRDKDGTEEGDAPEWFVNGGRPRWQRITYAALLAFGLCVFAYSRWMLFRDFDKFYFCSLWITLASLVAITVGMDRVGERVRKAKWKVSHAEILLFAAVIAVGIFMRTYRLNYYPPPDGIACVEEAQQGRRAYDLLFRGGHWWEFYISNLVTAVSFNTLGVSTLSLRIPPVVLSSLTLVVFYLLVRLLMGYKTALASTFLFAVSRWHLCYARISHNIFLPVFFVFLVIYLLVRARVTWRYSVFVWIGALAGFLLFSYAGYRATAPLAVCYLAGSAIGARRRRKIVEKEGERRIGGSGLRRGAGALIVALTVLAVSIPLFTRVPSVRFYFEAARRSTSPHQAYYAEKDIRQIVQERWRRIVSTALLFTYRGDPAPSMNLPYEPMLDPLTGALFFLGLAYCLVTPGRDHHLFFLAIFVFIAYMSAVFVHNLDVRRMIAMIPLAYFFVAAAISALWSRIGARCGKRGRRIAAAAAAVLCLLAFQHDYAVFFGKQISDARVRMTFKNRLTVLVHCVNDLPAGSHIIVVSPVVHNLFQANDLSWLRGYDMTGRCVRAIEDAEPLPDVENLYVLFQSPYDLKTLASRFMEKYPGAACRVYTDPDKNTLKVSICTLNGEGIAVEEISRGSTDIPRVSTSEN